MFDRIIRHRFAVIAAVAAVTAAFALQLPKLEMDPDTEAYVPKGHPIRVFWNEAKERFGLGRDILVAIEAEGPDGIFTPAGLRAVAELTEGIEGLDSVVARKVKSLSKAEAMIGTEDGLEVEPFFEEPPATLEQARAVRARVFENPVYLDRLVSRDGTIAAIIVGADQTYRASPPEVYRQIAEYVGTVELEGARILIAGSPAVEFVYGRQMAADLSNLIPLSLMAVVVILFLCFRATSLARLGARVAVVAAVALVAQAWSSSALAWYHIAALTVSIAMLTVRGVLLPALVVAIAVVWTWGLQAALGLPIYIAGTLVPPLLLAIGCADGIHIMERYFDKAAEVGSRDASGACKARQARDERDAIVRATMHELWRPIVLTSVTTAAGFGSLMVGRMTVYQVFGLTTAFGILVAMVMSLTLLPALLACLPLPAPPSRMDSGRDRVVPRALTRWAEVVEGHRRLTIGAGIALMVGLGLAARGLYVDYSWVESLAPDTPVLAAERVLRTRHGGTMPLNVIVRASEPDGIKDPALLRAIDTMLAELSEHPQVGDTRSIAEYVERMSQAMNEDRPEMMRIPDTRELVAQYLLLYSMSGNPTEYDDMIDYDYQAANLSILLRTDRLVVMDQVIARTEELLDKHVRPLGATATATGSAIVQKTVLDMILVSQVYSLATAAALVLIFMSILFRSLRDAMICMLPPLFTAVTNFGVMGLFDIPLGPDKAMISAIALGIGIDYSIHLMARFRDLVEEGMTVYQAIVEAMRTTGRAILFNGLVVVAGFAVLGFSASPSNATFGFMIAANMAVACLAALVLLPAALAVMGHIQMARAAHAPVRIGGKLITPAAALALGIGGGRGIRSAADASGTRGTRDACRASSTPGPERPPSGLVGGLGDASVPRR